MNVPFVDLSAQYKSIQPEIDQAIKNVISDAAFIGGKYVEEFERSFARLYGVKNAISCANGTDSLYIIMKMLGIGNGDEVITVANSWISSSETITQTGATPVFVDVDPEFYSIDENLVTQAINANTKAIVVVHLHGQMCNMEVLKSICEKYSLSLIEDCAQSHFSEFKDTRAGLFGIAGSFSFYPGKNLGAYGDAGCIITNDDAFAEKCKMFARHGALHKHNHIIEGINSRLDGLQAAILSAKLPYILEWTDQRIEKAKLYNDYLSEINQLKLPVVRKDTKHTFHLYAVRVQRREHLIAFLKERGIETAIHYPTPLPFLPCYEYLKATDNDFPVVSKIKHEILSLPMYPELSEEMIRFIASTIKEFYAH